MFKLRASEKAQADLHALTERDRAAANQRRADIARLTAEFEKAVGQMIEKVSSASTQLEASARPLTGRRIKARSSPSRRLPRMFNIGGDGQHGGDDCRSWPAG